MRPRTLLTLTGAVAAGTAVLTHAAYRRDLRAAERRIESGRQFIHSPHGQIEFAESGDGPAVLVIHGAGGGFDQGLDLGRTFLGDDYRVIAPSRFGYLRTAMPADASPAAQADAHRRVLDALHIDKAPVMAVSGGSPSAMQLCLKHPDRCSALVLVVPLAYAPDRAPSRFPSVFFEKVLTAISSSDFLFWAATKAARPTLLKTILGTPVDVYRNATAAERQSVDKFLLGILPISKRSAGLWNDAVVSSTLERYPLEDLRVPTLVTSAEDDQYGTYDSGFYTAEQIRDSRFVGFLSGGHLLLGHEDEVRSHITRFLKEHRVVLKPAMAS